MTSSRSVRSAVTAALADCQQAFWSVAVFSAVVNLLMLAGPLYMLQVYDRVLTSRSVPTLIALSAFLVGAYAFQAALDLIRSRIVSRSAALIDQHLGGVVHSAVIQLAVQTRQPSQASQPVRDLDQIRAFLMSSGPTAIADLPWMPVFLFVCYLIQPWLGAVALGGGLVLFALTFLSERASRAPVRSLAREGGARASMIEATRRNSETATAMGMTDSLGERWSKANAGYLVALQRASDVASSYGTISKVLRLLLQSLILGAGAFLVINDQLMAGAMIAASVMMGRALAPLEMVIANWRGFVAARDSLRRLRDTLARLEIREVTTGLSPPRLRLDVEQLTVIPPGGQKPVVSNVTFSAAAGEALGIIGPNGSGKTSLIRSLIGVWPAARGVVRLDGAPLDQWRRTDLGKYVGYMAQAAEFFDGTIAENIARMEPSPDDAAVLLAADQAGAHDLILRLGGYDTCIGDGGSLLSAGQRQRIALARALYGQPFLIVLDEPNANIDADGNVALERAIAGAKARGAIMVVVAHQASAISACDKLLVLANGIQKEFGPTSEVLAKVVAKPARLIAGHGAALSVVTERLGGTV